MRTALELWRNRFPRSMFDLINELDSVWNLEDATSSAEERFFRPSADVRETERAYLLSFDLPGVKQEDIKIDLAENTITVSGTRKSESEDKNQQAHRIERYYGKFERSFSFPKTADMDHVEANFENGVLQVVVPKSEATKARSVQIQSGKSNGFFSKFLGTREAEKVDSKH